MSEHAVDWSEHGENLAEEACVMGGQFADARRLMLAAWEAWTSGEPPEPRVLYELLSTWQAMAVAGNIRSACDALETIAEQFAEEDRL